MVNWVRSIREDNVNTCLERYGSFNAALMPHSKTTLEFFTNDNVIESNFDAENPEDWAGRFYWEAYFEEFK